MDLVLQRAQPVDVELDGGWRLTARVAEVADAHVDLEALRGVLLLPGGLATCEATMSWRTRVGAAERRGVLALADAGRLRLETAGEALQVQRRAFVRVPTELSAAIIADGTRIAVRTLDLSIGGMLLAPPEAEALPLHHAVRFVLDLGDLSVRGDGVVVRGTADGARAVHFEELEGRAERAVSRYVARRQRELIADCSAREAAPTPAAGPPAG